MSESTDRNESTDRTHPLPVQAELDRLDAEYATLRAEVSDRRNRMARLSEARRLLDAAAKMDEPLEYATLTKAAEYEGIDLSSVIDVLDSSVVDVPEFARCETIRSSF